MKKDFKRNVSLTLAAMIAVTSVQTSLCVSADEVGEAAAEAAIEESAVEEVSEDTPVEAAQEVLEDVIEDVDVEDVDVEITDDGIESVEAEEAEEADEESVEALVLAAEDIDTPDEVVSDSAVNVQSSGDEIEVLTAAADSELEIDALATGAAVDLSTFKTDIVSSNSGKVYYYITSEAVEADSVTLGEDGSVSGITALTAGSIGFGDADSVSYSIDGTDVSEASFAPAIYASDSGEVNAAAVFIKSETTSDDDGNETTAYSIGGIYNVTVTAKVTAEQVTASTTTVTVDAFKSAAVTVGNSDLIDIAAEYSNTDVKYKAFITGAVPDTVSSLDDFASENGAGTDGYFKFADSEISEEAYEDTGTAESDEYTSGADTLHYRRTDISGYSAEEGSETAVNVYSRGAGCGYVIVAAYKDVEDAQSLSDYTTVYGYYAVPIASDAKEMSNTETDFAAIAMGEYISISELADETEDTYVNGDYSEYVQSEAETDSEADEEETETEDDDYTLPAKVIGGYFGTDGNAPVFSGNPCLAADSEAEEVTYTISFYASDSDGNIDKETASTDVKLKKKVTTTTTAYDDEISYSDGVVSYSDEEAEGTPTATGDSVVSDPVYSNADSYFTVTATKSGSEYVTKTLGEIFAETTETEASGANLVTTDTEYVFTTSKAGKDVYMVITDELGNEFSRVLIHTYQENTAPTVSSVSGASYITDEDADVPTYIVDLFINDADEDEDSNAQSFKVTLSTDISSTNSGFTVTQDSDGNDVEITDFTASVSSKTATITVEAAEAGKTAEYTVCSDTVSKKTGEPLTKVLIELTSASRPTTAEFEYNDDADNFIGAGETLKIAVDESNVLTLYNSDDEVLGTLDDIDVSGLNKKGLAWIVGADSYDSDTYADNLESKASSVKVSTSKYAKIVSVQDVDGTLTNVADTSKTDDSISAAKTVTTASTPSSPVDDWTVLKALGLDGEAYLKIMDTKANSAATGISYLRLVDANDKDTVYLQIPIYVKPAQAAYIEVKENWKSGKGGYKADQFEETASSKVTITTTTDDDGNSTTTYAWADSDESDSLEELNEALKKIFGDETGFCYAWDESDTTPDDVTADDDDEEGNAAATGTADRKVVVTDADGNTYSADEIGALYLPMGTKVSVKATPMTASDSKAADKTVTYSTNSAGVQVTNAGAVTLIDPDKLEETSYVKLETNFNESGEAKVTRYLFIINEDATPKSITPSATSITLPPDGVQEIALSASPAYGYDTEVKVAFPSSIDVYYDSEEETTQSLEDSTDDTSSSYGTKLTSGTAVNLINGIGKLTVVRTGDIGDKSQITLNYTSNGKTKTSKISVKATKTDAYDNVKKLAEKNAKKADSLSCAVGSFLSMGVSVSPASANTTLNWTVSLDGSDAAEGTDYKIAAGVFQPLVSGVFTLYAETEGIDGSADILTSSTYTVTAYYPITGIHYSNIYVAAAETADSADEAEQDEQDEVTVSILNEDGDAVGTGIVSNGSLVLDSLTMSTTTDGGKKIYITPNYITSGFESGAEGITWTSNNPFGLSIVETESGVLEISPNAAGKYTITGQTAYSKQKFTIKLTITANVTEDDTDASVTMTVGGTTVADKGTYAMQVGDTANLNISVDDLSVTKIEVKAGSKAASVSKGVITAKNTGASDITVNLYRNKVIFKTVTFTVSVTEAVPLFTTGTYLSKTGLNKGSAVKPKAKTKTKTENSVEWQLFTSAPTGGTKIGDYTYTYDEAPAGGTTIVVGSSLDADKGIYYLVPSVVSNGVAYYGSPQQIEVFENAANKTYTSNASIAVKKGSSKTVSFVVLTKEGTPADINDGSNIVWTSSNANIAQAAANAGDSTLTDALGIYNTVTITGITAGTATLTGVIPNGSKKVTVKVTVSDSDVKASSCTSLEYSPTSSISLKNGGYAQLKYTLKGIPSGAEKAVDLATALTGDIGITYTAYKVSNVLKEDSTESTTEDTSTDEAVEGNADASYELAKNSDGTLAYTPITVSAKDGDADVVQIIDGGTVIAEINTATGIIVGEYAMSTNKKAEDYCQYYIKMTPTETIDSSASNIIETDDVSYIQLKISEAK